MPGPVETGGGCQGTSLREGRLNRLLWGSPRHQRHCGDKKLAVPRGRVSLILFVSGEKINITELLMLSVKEERS